MSLRSSLLKVFCLSCGAVMAAQANSAEKILQRQWPGNARITIPQIKQAPVIDGILSPGEWKNAAQLAGFTRLNGNYITTGSGSVRLMRDKTHLYIAVRTTTPNNDPGGSLTASARVHDGTVHQDDSLDFLLISDKDPEKVYHWILNSRDTVFDRLYWDPLDIGDITDEELKRCVASRLPSELVPLAHAVYDNWIANIDLIPGIEEAIAAL